MRTRTWLMALAFAAMPSMARAQEPAGSTQSTAAEQTTLRAQLMPQQAALQVMAPVAAEKEVAPAAQPVMAARGSSTAYMIAGAALFAAGLIVGGDAGTVLVLAGAGIGAYGLYIHFR